MDELSIRIFGNSVRTFIDFAFSLIKNLNNENASERCKFEGEKKDDTLMHYSNSFNVHLQ